MDHSFADVLTEAYLEDPCGVLPNALWKTLDGIGRRDIEFTVEDGISEFSISGDGSPAIVWKRTSSTPLTVDELMVSGSSIVPRPLVPESHRTAAGALGYFRMLHRHEPVPQPVSVSGYHLRRVDTDHEAGAVARFLQRCYPDTDVTPEVVGAWTRRPVFSPDLWLWILDDNRGTAALGIAEFDRSINEGSLEWIQSDPAHRAQGLAKWVAAELLIRLADRARFTTVSGENSNPGNPEALYRSIGFEGDDTWILFANP